MKKINDISEYISNTLCILCEVKLLWLLRHSDIVEIKNILLSPFKKEFKDIYVVFEQMESDLHHVIKANEDLKRERHKSYLYEGFVPRSICIQHTGGLSNSFSNFAIIS